MTLLNGYNPHIRLDFSEANIISENTAFRDKAAFMSRMADLKANTSDPILLRDLNGLIEKIQPLNDSEFKTLLSDAASGSLLFPPNYELPVDGD